MTAKEATPKKRDAKVADKANVKKAKASKSITKGK